MAEPTLRDVLNAVTKLTSEVATVRHDVEKMHRAVSVNGFELAELKGAIGDFRAESKLSFEEVDARFDALDVKLGAFQGVIASGREDVRDLRQDVSAIHKGLVRSKAPNIPADLPSEVRAKSGKPEAKRAPARATRKR